MRKIAFFLLALFALAQVCGCVTKNAPDPSRNKAQAREAVNDMNRAFN